MPFIWHKDQVTLAIELRVLIEALEEPALLIQRGKVIHANQPARVVLGAVIEGTDVRLAIRHPEALEHILPGRPGSVEITGLGELGRPWTITVKDLGQEAFLVRMIDRSPAVAAEKMRVDFVANASHELRTPLSTIIGYAETLADSSKVEAGVSAKFAGVIRGEAARMLQIIEDLMSLSRIEAERYVSPTERVAVQDLLRTVVANAGPLASETGCTIKVEGEADLPWLVGDRAQLVQMLDNLLTNAIRYGCGEKGCTIIVSATASAGKVRIAVEDNGIGIAREHLHRVTERFYRVDAGRSRNFGGTGLGLSIVKHIVERHKGVIEIFSSAGEGTKVVVTLPCVEMLLSQK